MMASRQRALSIALVFAPALIYVVVVLTFTLLSANFLTLQNFINILIQSSSVAVMAIGMTFVLLSAGIDLSVGSVMFLTSAIVGSVVVGAGWSTAAALPLMLVAGLLCGLVNGMLITRLRMAPFIVTLSMLFVARGCGLWMTETRAINLPDTFRQLATARFLGIPSPIWILALVLIVAHWVLTRTSFGRQLYAVGNAREAAKKAGVRVDRLLVYVYMASGVCAAIGGMIALAQLSAVSPNLGQGRELDVIAATVLGGTSLFGGRGTAFGSVLGAVLVETVRNGLNVIDADPYIYPVITGSIIFTAVFIDSARHQRLAIVRRRVIRKESSVGGS